MHFMTCSVLKEAGVSCRRAAFLSPSLTIKFFSNVKYMGNIFIDECEVLSVSYLVETSSVGILLRDCIWRRLSAGLRCSGCVLFFL